MAQKTQVRIINNRFKHVTGQAIDGTRDAVNKAIDAGEAEAKSRLSRGESQRGYALNTLYDSIKSEKTGTLQGRVKAGGDEAWWGRFFEFGTVHIAPIPFMRPASRKMRKVFKDEMGDIFKGYSSRRRF